MSQTLSPSLARCYGLARVARAWKISRASVYRSLKETPPNTSARRPGPVGACSDAELADHIRQHIAASRLHGEGYRKLWARLRFAGVRASPRRVRRVMRANGLLAPHRVGRTEAKPHDGTIITGKVNEMWGTDMTQTITIREGTANVFVAVEHSNSELVGIHASRSANRFEALEPVRQGVHRCFGAIAPGVARGLKLRHDHGSNYMSGDFQDEIECLGCISPEATAVVVWRIDDGEHVCTIEQDAPSLAVFDDGRNGLWVASNGTDATFIEMPRQSESFATVSPGITTALAYGPDGTLAWCGRTVSADLEVGDAALWVANPLTGRARIDAPLSEVGRIAFDSQGRYVAVVGSQSVRVWDLATGQEAAPPESPFWIEHDVSEELPAVANFLAAPSVAKARAQRGYVRTLVSPNGRFIAIDHSKQVVSLWNAPAAAEIVVFSTVAALTCMTFNADGTLFATGDARGGVMLWQTDGTSLGHLKHDEPIAQLAFSPDGDFLAIASMDSMLRVWIASPSLLAAKVGEKVSGSLTDEEWARYLGDEPRGE